MPYSRPLDHAVQLAAIAHAGQLRKDPTLAIPYIAHPVTVALLLQSCGFSEEVVIAALLHDVVEDTDLTLPELERRFGAQVARLVEDVTEPTKDLPWEERKQRYLTHLALPHTSPLAVAISLADKIHNMRSLLDSLERAQDDAAVLAVFRRGPAPTLAFYRQVLAVADARADLPTEATPLLQAYREALDTLSTRLT